MTSTRRQVVLTRFVAVTFLSLACTASLPAQTPSFTSFDAPGAGTGVLQGTFVSGINLSGTIAGYYVDSSNVQHGFLRERNGSFIEFSPALSNLFIGPINNAGQVLGTGYQTKSPFQFVGFIRNPGGTYTFVSPAGSTFTLPSGINNSGEVVGSYSDSSNVSHGFLRDASGNYTVIDDPDALLGNGTGTSASFINDNGVIAGSYNDKNTGTTRGFVRDQFGNFTNFDAASTGSVTTAPAAINLSGEIAGIFYSGSGLVTYGFVRDASGNITDFSVPSAKFTQVFGMNDSGVVVGFWQNAAGYDIGFQRNAGGNLTFLNAPNPNYQTIPKAINDNGRIAGNWEDTSYATHGFIK